MEKISILAKDKKGFTPHLLRGKKGSTALTPKKDAGFTLPELLVSVIIALLILLIISSIFSLNQKVFRKSNIKAELVQNARMTLDLMAREIRQAKELVTPLPPDDSNPSLVAHELQFEDGHTESRIQYIKYYLDGTDLKRQIIVYYFSPPGPPNYVYWDDFDAFGPPVKEVLEDRIIGENFNNLDFYGEDNIHVELILEKRNESIRMESIINPRNI